MAKFWKFQYTDWQVAKEVIIYKENISVKMVGHRMRAEVLLIVDILQVFDSIIC